MHSQPSTDAEDTWHAVAWCHQRVGDNGTHSKSCAVWMNCPSMVGYRGSAENTGACRMAAVLHSCTSVPRSLAVRTMRMDTGMTNVVADDAYLRCQPCRAPKPRWRPPREGVGDAQILDQRKYVVILQSAHQSGRSVIGTPQSFLQAVLAKSCNSSVLATMDRT
jgi:hypothetical protein